MQANQYSISSLKLARGVTNEDNFRNVQAFSGYPSQFDLEECMKDTRKPLPLDSADELLLPDQDLSPNLSNPSAKANQVMHVVEQEENSFDIEKLFAVPKLKPAQSLAIPIAMNTRSRPRSTRFGVERASGAAPNQIQQDQPTEAN